MLSEYMKKIIEYAKKFTKQSKTFIKIIIPVVPFYLSL